MNYSIINTYLLHVILPEPFAPLVGVRESLRYIHFDESKLCSITFKVVSFRYIYMHEIARLLTRLLGMAVGGGPIFEPDNKGFSSLIEHDSSSKLIVSLFK